MICALCSRGFETASLSLRCCGDSDEGCCESNEPTTPSKLCYDCPVAEIVIRLKPGRERPVQLGHPWIFSGAIETLDPGLEPGTTVTVAAADGTFRGRGYINPRCAIAVRILTRTDEPIDGAFFVRRVMAAEALRRTMVPPDTDAYRLINGEGDGLPGFIVDRYAGVLVVQCLTAGADRSKPLLIDAVREVVRPQGIYERSSGSVRREEGLATHEGVLSGDVPAEPILAHEAGLRFWVDVRSGQKTGFFLDQRDNRIMTRELARDRTVLNAFAYSGAFSVYAGAGRATQVVSLESSAPGLELARRNWSANDLPDDARRVVAADVFDYLRTSDRVFDLLILDPPALVKRRHDVQRGARAYKDLHRWAFRRAAPHAYVMTFSCSASRRCRTRSLPGDHHPRHLLPSGPQADRREH